MPLDLESLVRKARISSPVTVSTAGETNASFSPNHYHHHLSSEDGSNSSVDGGIEVEQQCQIYLEDVKKRLNLGEIHTETIESADFDDDQDSVLSNLVDEDDFFVIENGSVSSSDDWSEGDSQRAKRNDAKTNKKDHHGGAVASCTKNCVVHINIDKTQDDDEHREKIEFDLD